MTTRPALPSLDENATISDQQLTELEDKYYTMQKENNLMKEKLADLEGHNRRHNVRIVGLPENFGGPRPTVFYFELLVEVFGGGTFSSPPEVDRANRTAAPKPPLGGRPRPVLLCLHRYQVKDVIICEACRRGGSFLQGPFDLHL
uniref:Uncharacterized protein n=2 Tax=Nothobranchius furzeri TaxID=105023 RepID=A0A1A7ZKQ0_NOTFU